MQESVGNWTVAASTTQAEAYNHKTGVSARAAVQEFSRGRRVSESWSAPVPKTVITLANRLIRKAEVQERNALARRYFGGV